MGRHVKSLGPVGGWKMGLEEKRAHHVGDRADHALGVPILLGRVWAREPLDGATRGKERLEIKIAELAIIIILKFFYLSVKLSLEIRGKFDNHNIDISFRF